MTSESVRLVGISLGFAGIPPRWDENFPYEQAQKMLDETVFFQRHNKLFDVTEIEESVGTWDKNQVT